jgi:hypothetical protein
MPVRLSTFTAGVMNHFISAPWIPEKNPGTAASARYFGKLRFALMESRFHANATSFKNR